MNVMVVEDDPTDRKLIIAVLQIGGYRVSEKSSAEDALEAIIAEQPDLVLLDLKLPGMDGLTLARQLKRDPRTRDIPIVAVTAADRAVHQERRPCRLAAMPIYEAGRYANVGRTGGARLRSGHVQRR